MVGYVSRLPLTLNQRVQGSNPCTPTNEISYIGPVQRGSASQKCDLGSIWEAPLPLGELSLARPPITGYFCSSTPEVDVVCVSGCALARGFLVTPQPFRQDLEELPTNAAVPFDERAEFPEGESVADQVGDRRHRGRARASIDQGYFPEVIARTERGELHTFARNPCLSGIDQEEGGAAGSLHDHSFVLCEAALLEQPSDLLGLPAIHIGKKFNTPQRCLGVAPRRHGRWCLAARPAGRDGAALQEVQRPILEGPFDVPPRAIDFFAVQGEGPERCELGVVKAELADLRR